MSRAELLDRLSFLVMALPDFHRNQDKIRSDQDLYDAGLTSMGSVDLMLAVEDVFGVRLLAGEVRHETFASLELIAAAIENAFQKSR